MIINRIWSEHVLKYAELDLHDLPSEGLIAVSGQNESGKSTIGEIICFALFGRTFSLPPDEVVKVIRWGEPRCSASVEFTIDDEQYSVSRFLDDNGYQGARLSRVGHDEPFARGVDAVQEALGELIGFGFDEFIESFYLAQREITTPHPHSTAVKRMAGIAALEIVTTVAELEIEHEQTSISETQTLIHDLENLVAELEFDEAHLPQLEADHHAKTAQQEQDHQHVAELEHTNARYEETATHIATATKPMADVSLQTSLQDWQSRLGGLEASLDTLHQQHADDATLAPTDLKNFVHDTRARLDHFTPIKSRARLYREQLAYLLSERTDRPDNLGDRKPLADQQADISDTYDAAKRSRSTAQIIWMILLILSLVGWILWGLLTFASDAALAQQISGWLQQTIGNDQWSSASIVASAAGLCTLGFALLAFRSRRLQTKIEDTRQQSKELELEIRATHREAGAIDNLDVTPLPQAVDALERMRDPEIGKMVLPFRTNPGATFLDTESIETLRGTIDHMASEQNTRILDASKHMTQTVSTVKANMDHRKGELAALDEALGEERDRRRKFDEFNTIIQGHQTQIGIHKRRIAARRLACDLVEGGCHHIAKTFNRDVRGLVSRTLPLLTEGRYEHLKIDESLYVQVFSSIKRDFMNLEEISSGTQRQIMLAVRLALSQEFINTTLERHQFVFLDEPFAFFDQERTRAALQALPGLSHELRQIWIVAQEFPDNFPFDAHVRCAKELDRLTVSTD